MRRVIWTRVDEKEGSEMSRGRVVPFVQPQPVGKLLTIEQVAGLLQVSEKTVKRLITRGEIIRLKIGRSVRVTELEVSRYIARLADEAAREFGG